MLYATDTFTLTKPNNVFLSSPCQDVHVGLRCISAQDMRSPFMSSIKIEQRQKCHITVCKHHLNVIDELTVIISDFTGDGAEACWTLLRNCLEGHRIFSSPLKYPWRNVRHSPKVWTPLYVNLTIGAICIRKRTRVTIHKIKDRT